MCAVVELFELCERKTENPDFHFAGKKSKAHKYVQVFHFYAKTENPDFQIKKSNFSNQKIQIFKTENPIFQNRKSRFSKQKIQIFKTENPDFHFSGKKSQVYPSFPILRDLGTVAACKQGECNSQPYFANRETDRRRYILQENQC